MQLTQAMLLVLMLAGAGAGCSRPAPSPPAPAPSPATTGGLTSPPTTANSPAGPSTTPTAESARHCTPQDGRRIVVSFGSINCAQAYAIAAAYDLQGQKYQQIQELTCYSGTAQTAPVMLICSSEVVEFAVSEPTG